MGQGYRDLVAWQKAVELVTDVYRATAAFPESERFGLTSQMRRAAVSVGENPVAETARASTRRVGILLQ